VLGARPVFLGFRDGNLSQEVDAAAQSLNDAFRDLQPEVVLLPWFGDGHADHRALNESFARAKTPSGVAVWGFEVWTPLPVNRLVDISDVIDRKHRAIAAHTADVLLEAEAMMGLNRYRAAMARLAGTHAEAYYEAPADEYKRRIAAVSGA